MLKKCDKLPKRTKVNDYSVQAVSERQKWLSDKCSVDLAPVDHIPFGGETFRRNVENLTGSVSLPVGITGPLRVSGEYAKGDFYVPFATTQGTLVDSYHKGMAAAAMSGEINVRVLEDRVDISPVFTVSDVRKMVEFREWVKTNVGAIRREAESTSSYAKLLQATTYPLGRKVMLNLSFEVGDASGLNMINIAAYKACEFIKQSFPIEKYYLRSNLSSDKKPSFFNFINSYGKKVTADIVLKSAVIKKYLMTRPEDMYDFWYSGLFGSLQAGMVGFNAHYANALAAVFIATGQDVAQVVNASIGVTTCEMLPGNDLYMSVTLPALIVATVGGGTGLPYQKKYLETLGCAGSGKVRKFAEILAATALAGEIGIVAALASNIFAEGDIKLRKR